MSILTKITPSGLNDSMRFVFNNFEIKLVENEQEYDETLRLRYEVFNIEMGEGLSSSSETGRDEDQYDPYCDHLIVKSIEDNNKIVGTYRFMRKEAAENGIGFYSELEFDLSKLKETGEEIIELGRSCVHKDFRSKNVMSYLWAGLAKLIDEAGAKYLFGCGSIHSDNVNTISSIFRYFKEKHYSDEYHRVYPKKGFEVKGLNPYIEVENAKEVFRSIPPILKGYIRLSAQCCGEPAWDPEFGCADLFILLDTKKITKKYSDHFFRNV
jgi:putative hemolysin